MRKNHAFLSFLKKFARHRVAMAALVIFLLEILVIVFGPYVVKMDAVTSDFANMAAPPSGEHVLGTDEIGRDILARIIYGGRVSLEVGILSTLLSMVIGVPLGVIAGYYQGRIGNIIMRAVDMFMSFPHMVMALVLIAVMEPSIGTIVLAIGILGWTRPCKLLYGSVMSVRSKEYVEAAIAIGTSNFKVLTQYVIPNAISPLWVSVAFSVSSAIISESSLSFLGAGIQPPQSSWGNIIYSAQKLNILTGKLWMWVPACIVLLITIVCINMIGEGVRDALDPKMRR